MLITHSVLWVSRLRERNEGLLSHLPASSHMCLVGLFLLHAVIAKGWHFPHAAGLFSPFTWLETIGGRYGPLRVLRPAGRDAEKHASLYTCGFLSLPLNLGQCARGWSSAHVSNASYVEAVHEPHQHLGFLPRQVLCSQVRRVGLGGDLLHSELAAAHRLLKPLFLDVLRFAQPCSAYYGHCRTGADVQPNSGDSTQVFGKRLNSHRLCCCTVASVPFCFCGAGGRFVQALIRCFPCKIMPPLTDFLDCLSPAQSASARTCKALG